jgi:CHAT domain-containing protein/tetratricopeptide (TPR) repeat protein
MTGKGFPLSVCKGFWRTSLGCRILFAGLCLLLPQNQLALTACARPSVPTNHRLNLQGQSVPALEPGKAVERQINAGETHSYSVSVTVGQYAKFVARQQGISVVLKFIHPDGSAFAEADVNGEAQGEERLALVTEVTGTCRLEVKASNRTAPNGRYEIRIEELRPASEVDKAGAAGEKALLDGDALRAQNRAEALRNAIKKYEEAATLYHASGDQQGEGLAIARVANIHYRLGDLPKSLEAFNKSLPLFKGIGDKKLEAYVLNETGLIYQTMSEHDKALENYNQSLNLQRQVQDRWGEAATLDNIGLLYSSRGYKRKALEYYLEALQIHREVKDREGEAASLNNLGSVSNAIGKKDKALEYYEQAVSIMRAIGDKRSEAITLSNLGVLNAQLNDKEKTILYYNQALQIAQETGNRQGEAVALNNIGQFYSATGDKPKALEYYMRSLEMRRKNLDKRGEANMLANIGGIYNAAGDRQKAFDYYQQALEKVREAGDYRLQAGILQSIGRAHDLSGDKQKALDFYNQSLSLTRSLNDQVSEAATLATIAQFERDRNNLLEARKQIEAAIEIIDYLRSSIETQDTRRDYFATVKKYYDFYVELLMQLQGQNTAGDYQAEALQVSERVRARMLIETLIEAKAKIRQGVDPALLERERDLQKQLSAKADRLTRLMSGKPTDEQLAAARSEVEAARNQIQQVRTQIRVTSPHYAALTQPTALSLADIQKQVVDENTLLLEYALGEERSYLWAITSHSITSHALPKRQEIETAVKQVHDLLTARNKFVLYETAPEKQKRVAKADAEYPGAALALSKLILNPVADQLGNKKLLIVCDGALQYIPFASLPVPEGGSVGSGEAGSGRSGEVGRQGGGEERSAGRAQKARNGSAPSARPSTPTPLHPTSPPPSLSPSLYRPLILDHEIVSIPSAATLALLRNEVSQRQVAPKTIAILADPVFDKDDERFKVAFAKRSANRPTELVAQRRGLNDFANEEISRALEDTNLSEGDFKLPRLPGTRREAETIATLVAKSELKAALDFTANRQFAMSPDLSQYRYLHFATHGIINSQYPELSGIVLSLIDEDGNQQSGFLRGHEVYNLHLPAELVVLSSCQTGLGKNIRGEGVVGLTRSFMYAGAARVMVSLWAVNDKSTAILMAQFYRDLLGARHQTPASALRSAQLSMLKDKQFNAPYYWAAFILQGEPN